ncbi:hypothetical protein KZY98_00560 [Croceibacter atlanticus]|uniref:Uncharacterized protein n=1 Tax=Croceibacter atlanticus (strain ATCC BAA-628 / JCM 21780 / CIP 108009 / IAM 15332 / KCTC 12090 / HTCC2559) TaxID=216432 RepID=A3U8S4_CROAH|nr:hypothetical protein [Croceibacter atlanticus]EAP86210.1 hypothetical protein CA2559_09258 [Croceibacter atlanticus HTCC2559]MBW4968929.1 hypothetical protein [Croceibacter atlanticus]
MPKLYSNTSSEEVSQLKPKKETIAFLLNYSKALRVIDCDPLKFETILN